MNQAESINSLINQDFIDQMPGLFAVVDEDMHFPVEIFKAAQ